MSFLPGQLFYHLKIPSAFGVSLFPAQIMHPDYLLSQSVGPDSDGHFRRKVMARDKGVRILYAFSLLLSHRKARG